MLHCACKRINTLSESTADTNKQYCVGYSTQQAINIARDGNSLRQKAIRELSCLIESRVYAANTGAQHTKRHQSAKL
jgi:hypothetical protein